MMREVGHADIATRRRIPDGLLLSIVGSVVTLLVLEVVAWLLIDRVAERSALDHVSAVAAESALVGLSPHLTPEALTGDPAAAERLAGAGRTLLAHDDVEHVKVWVEAGSGVGRIIWADEAELVDRAFPLDQAEASLFASQALTAEISELDAEENQPESAGGTDRLIEVYVGARASDGTPVLVEIYAPARLVDSRAADLRASFLPLMTFALAVLALAQIGLVWVLGRRLARAERRQSKLLQRIIDTSDAERRRVAAEVHDGVVQDLVGISFALAGAARHGAGESHNLHRLAESTREAVGSLRGLLTSIYPVSVPPEGWIAGLDDLVGELTSSGVSVTIEAADVRLGPTEQLLLLRVGREALRNVIAHADATTVSVRLVERSNRLRLTITDDGRGFDHTRLPAGHFGLKILRDLVDDAGGSIETDSTPGLGTTLRVDLAVSR